MGYYSDDIGKFIYHAKSEGIFNRDIISHIERVYNQQTDERQIRRWHAKYKIENGLEDKLVHYKSDSVKVTSYTDFTAEPEYPNIQSIFQNYIRDAFAKQNTVTIGIVSDEHLPDEDEKAMLLSVKLINKVKPDLIIHNGDSIDFETESKYPSTHSSMSTDWLSLALQKWDYYWSKLSYNPAYRLKLSGNHNDRYGSSNKLSASERNALLRDLNRSLNDRKILYGGPNCHSLKYNRDLLIRHEGSIGVNAARGSLLGPGNGFLLSVFAHAHKVQVSGQTSDAGVHISLVSGCIQNNPPNYEKRFIQNWQQGMIFVTLFGDNIPPAWQNLKYSDVKNKKSVMFGGEIVEVE